jgi:hypothetical protein
MSTDIQTSGLILQTEVDNTNPIISISDTVIQAEVDNTNPILAVSDVVIQAEVAEGNPVPQIGDITLQVEIVEGEEPEPIPDILTPTVKDEYALPKYKSVKLTNEKPETIADAFVELNRNLDWVFKSLNEAIKNIDENEW